MAGGHPAGDPRKHANGMLPSFRQGAHRPSVPPPPPPAQPSPWHEKRPLGERSSREGFWQQPEFGQLYRGNAEPPPPPPSRATSGAPVWSARGGSQQASAPQVSSADARTSHPRAGVSVNFVSQNATASSLLAQRLASDPKPLTIAELQQSSPDPNVRGGGLQSCATFEGGYSMDGQKLSFARLPETEAPQKSAPPQVQVSASAPYPPKEQNAQQSQANEPMLEWPVLSSPCEAPYVRSIAPAFASKSHCSAGAPVVEEGAHENVCRDIGTEAPTQLPHTGVAGVPRVPTTRPSAPIPVHVAVNSGGRDEPRGQGGALRARAAGPQPQVQEVSVQSYQDKSHVRSLVGERSADRVHVPVASRTLPPKVFTRAPPTQLNPASGDDKMPQSIVLSGIDGEQGVSEAVVCVDDLIHVDGGGKNRPRSVRVHIRTLEFHGTGSFSLSGLFESVSVRVAVQLGGERASALAAAGALPSGAPRRPKWIDDGPATQPSSTKFGRAVADDGRYSARITCEFDEAIDLLWLPMPGEAHPPGHLSADVWLERQTALEKFDSLLSRIGLGSDLPQYDRNWIGRAVVSLPEEGVDSSPYPWHVEVDGITPDGPVPKALSVGIEWVHEDPEFAPGFDLKPIRDKPADAPQGGH